MSTNELLESLKGRMIADIQYNPHEGVRITFAGGEWICVGAAMNEVFIQWPRSTKEILVNLRAEKYVAEILEKSNQADWSIRLALLKAYKAGCEENDEEEEP